MKHHVQCKVIGTILMGEEFCMLLGATRFEEIEVQMKSGMGDSLMARFAFIVDSVGHQKEVVFAVSYQVLLSPT